MTQRYTVKMRFSSITFAAALAGAALAQDQCNLLPVAIQSLPLKAEVGNQTLCEKYTPANSTQYEFMTKLINLAFSGKFTPLPNLWPAVRNGTYQSSGILDPNAIYRDPCFTVTPINLVPYFNGTWKSNNRGGVRHFFSATLFTHLTSSPESRLLKLPRRRRRHRPRIRRPRLGQILKSIQVCPSLRQMSFNPSI